MKRPLAFLVFLVTVASALSMAGCGGADDGEGGSPSRLVEKSRIGLPADFPSWRFESLRPAPPGLFVVTFSNPADKRPWVIVFDTEGKPRWWYNPDTRALWGQVIGNGDLVWARSFGDGYGLDPRMAHEVRSESGKLVRLVRTGG